jgi:exosortase O
MQVKHFFQRLLSARSWSDRFTPVLTAVGLAGLWLWLYRAVYGYLGTIFTREEFRTNQVVLVGVLALLVSQARKNRPAPGLLSGLNAYPQLHPPALALALVGSALYLLVERFLDVNTFSATLFGLASYGMLGLWMQPARWRQGLPAALLLVGALPFGEHMQTFVGYPVRLLTAAIVRDGLAAAGVQSVGIDTILVFENGISQVDLPCSGVKSLWTGGLFFLAATWIDRRSLSLRWGIAALGFAILLLAANLGRVAVLVTVGQVAGWRLLAEMLHVPLGILGFTGACALSLLLLRRCGQAGLAAGAALPPVERPRWLAPALGGAIALMALLYSGRPEAALPAAQPAWQFPPGLATEPWPLSEGERDWLLEAGVQAAERRRFAWRGQRGSLLLVTSASWRAHHRPERCFQVYGLAVNEAHTGLAGPGFPVRLLSLGAATRPGAGNRQDLLAAAYWLQSADQTTDDYAARIWADLAPERQQWVLVTVLFDTPLDAGSADARALYLALHQAVHQHLIGEEKQ